MDLIRLSDDELLASTPRRPEAFGEFYARHEAAVLGFMLRRTGVAPIALTDELLDRIERHAGNQRVEQLLARLTPEQADGADEVTYTYADGSEQRLPVENTSSS